MNDDEIPMRYLTVAEAAMLMQCGERTIRRWMTARLVTIYRRDDGRIVLDRLELPKVERDQRRRNPVRSRKRAEMFAQVAGMTYDRA